jgi:hypothetical protein
MLKSTISRAAEPDRTNSRPSRRELPRGVCSMSDTLVALHRSIGNQAVLRMLSRLGDRRDPDLSIREKAVHDNQEGDAGLVDEQTPPPTSGGGKPPVIPAAPARTAGIEYFTVTWQKHPMAGPNNARFHLHFLAKFRDDSVYDPKCAEFRQNVMAVYECTAGTHKGDKADTSPMHDDHYSRNDDLKARPITSVDFESQDNPGVRKGHTEFDDVITFSFTAEQMIIDTCQTPNKVIAHIGPHTGVITGSHPRDYANVPEAFEIFD